MGSRILAGRYELISKIGEGGMSSVYLAVDKRINKRVKLYVIVNLLNYE